MVDLIRDLEAEATFWHQNNEARSGTELVLDCLAAPVVVSKLPAEVFEVDTEDEENEVEEDAEEDDDDEDSLELEARQAAEQREEEMLNINPREAFIPFVRHTFLALSAPGLAHQPKKRRTRSVPEISTVDRYAREVHILMFKHRGVGKRATKPASDRVEYRDEEFAPRCQEADTEVFDSSREEEEDGYDDDDVEEESELEMKARSSSASDAAAPSAERAASRALIEEPLEAVLARVPRDEAGEPLSLGSSGHSFGDCRPCVYFASEQNPCTNGVRCLFCHCAHSPRRRIRLCRRKRLEMRASVAAVVADAGVEGVASPPRYVPISWKGPCRMRNRER